MLKLDEDTPVTIPECPRGCGGRDAVERIGAIWFCSVCARTFSTPKTKDGDNPESRDDRPRVVSR